MLSPDRISDLALFPDAAADYEIVRRAIAHIRGNWRTQPDIADIADAAGVTRPICITCSDAGPGSP